MEKKTWQCWSDEEDEEEVVVQFETTIKTEHHQAIENESPEPKAKKLKITYDDIALIGPVRKKSERKQLEAFDCLECEAYFGSLNMTDEERRLRLKNCSRHRGATARPSTPEGFWETEIPTTPEAIAKGLIRISKDSKLLKVKDTVANDAS